MFAVYVLGHMQTDLTEGVRKQDAEEEEKRKTLHRTSFKTCNSSLNMIKV
jgi:hypothetical protein